MLENYMNINNVWMPVLIIQSDTEQIFGETILDNNIRYSVSLLKSGQENGKYIYCFVIHSKEYITLPGDAKQKISDLQSANAALGQQVSQLTLANTMLGKQVAALSLQLKGGK